MASITLEQAIAHRDAWLAADLAIAQNQSYTMGRITYTRADAPEVRRNLTYWENMVGRLSSGSAGSMRSRLAVPLDC